MEHSKLSAEFTTVAVFVASLLVSIMAWLSELFPPGTLTGPTGWIIRSLTATGVYLLLFKIVINIYFRFMWKLMHRDRLVAGCWSYVYNDSYDITVKQYKDPNKSGVARLRHRPEGISLTAESGNNSTTAESATTSAVGSAWESTSSSLNEERIDLSFNLVGEIGAGQGFAVLHIIVQSKEWWRVLAKLPQEISGYYFVVATETRVVRWGRVKFNRV